jgi:DNA-binding MarR family transcriptional regulator
MLRVCPVRLTARRVRSDTARFRRFNRTYTRFIGTLNEGLLNSEFSLAEGRVLYEIANRKTPTASEIAEALGLDPGYLSRLLRKFEERGLLRKKTSGEDGRSVTLNLTVRGRAAFNKLNSLSEEQAGSILAGLAPEHGGTDELHGRN